MSIQARTGSMALMLLSLPLIPRPAQAVQVVPVPGQSRQWDVPPHVHFDELLHEVFWDITIIGVLMAVVAAYFLFAYRRRFPDEVGRLQKLSPQAALGWMIIPVALFMADDIYLFAKGWELHKQYREVPENAYEIRVTGAMWSWTYTYPNEVETYGELKVPAETPILLRMSSEDVVHSHFIQQYRVTEDLMPGRVTYMWFMPDKVGEYVVTCREYCGAGHSSMYGKVIVMAREEFNAWLESEAAAISASATVASAQQVVSPAADVSARDFGR
ncbi:MAG: cytochrome c oxidase subunit II [Mariprofundaceae bacterium]|nr:cytochrome c oxidase subunit II [Mariprofundaceae bacterium]